MTNPSIYLTTIQHFDYSTLNSFEKIFKVRDRMNILANLDNDYGRVQSPQDVANHSIGLRCLCEWIFRWVEAA